MHSCQTGKVAGIQNGYDGDEKSLRPDVMKTENGKDVLLPPPPPLPRKVPPESRGEKQGPTVARAEEDDIFVGDGVDYAMPSKDMSQSPLSEDMEESPRDKERASYFSEPAYGPAPPSNPSHDWQHVVS